MQIYKKNKKLETKKLNLIKLLLIRYLKNKCLLNIN